MVVHIDVEYCGTCGYATKFEEMKQILQKQSDVNLTGHEGRRASFEVKILKMYQKLLQKLQQAMMYQQSANNSQLQIVQ
ncbi:uncharacterized protein CBL_04645 [Carabus blaptoides fortunei]